MNTYEVIVSIKLQELSTRDATKFIEGILESCIDDDYILDYSINNITESEEIYE